MYIWFYQSYQMLAPNIQVFKQPEDLCDLNPGLRERLVHWNWRRKSLLIIVAINEPLVPVWLCAASAQPLALINILPFFLWPASNSAHNSASYCLLHKHRGSHAAWPSPHTHTHVHTRTRSLTLSPQPHALGCCDWEGCCQLREYESGRMTSLLFTGIRSSLAAPPHHHHQHPHPCL